MISIRCFRNYDAPSVARLWTEHRRESGLDSPINSTVLEVVVLARPYFHASNLLTAVEGETVVGFIHWLKSAERGDEAVVAALAVSRREDRDEIAGALLDAAVGHAVEGGARRLLVGQAPEHWTGYVGLGRAGNVSGVAESDVSVRRWATEKGFLATRELSSHILNISTFRPAYDRDLIALRRSATVDRRRDVNDQPFRIAAAMSHLEVHRFSAVERTGRLIADVDILVGDPEMMVVSGGTVMVSRWRGYDNPSNLSHNTAIRFVLSAAISELAAERISRIQATVESKNVGDTHTLQAVGFQEEYRGTIYYRDL